jgi:serine/threonine protein kinase
MIEENTFDSTNLDDDITKVQYLESENTKNRDLELTIASLNIEESTNGRPALSSLAESRLEIGSLIKNTYKLVDVLGEGGMGTVYKAINKVWEEVEARDPYVAIKVLKPELSANKDLVRSLYSDFDRTKMLSNCTNIIKVFGFDRDGAHVFMTMEYLTGQTLGDYLNREPMSLAQAWFIIEGIGNALAYAHRNNIVHRDIKPGNIILTQEGDVKVLDFGIASKINEIEGDETKFGGHELGAYTTAYASPEMQRDFIPDARDDIYAFACVIYEILTGNQFYKQKTHKAKPIHGLNARQMEALNKGLAFERDIRTASINELLQKLKPVKVTYLKPIIIAIGLFLSFAIVFWIVDKYVLASKKMQLVTTQIPQDSAQADQVNTVLVPKPLVAPPVQIPETTPLIKESSATDADTGFFATSNDGAIYLQTSKPSYKNGEAFQLSFTLQQPRYIRLIDRDAQGQITILRPNPKQKDKILLDGKEQVFPPNGFKIPVKGAFGKCTITVIASNQPFLKAINFLNEDGSVSDVFKQSAYSWVQVHYEIIK